MHECMCVCVCVCLYIFVCVSVCACVCVCVVFLPRPGGTESSDTEQRRATDAQTLKKKSKLKYIPGPGGGESSDGARRATDGALVPVGDEGERGEETAGVALCVAAVWSLPLCDGCSSTLSRTCWRDKEGGGGGWVRASGRHTHTHTLKPAHPPTHPPTHPCTHTDTRT